VIEGSGSEYLTNGSGSGRHKNIWILRIRIRIHNTVRNEERGTRSVADFCHPGSRIQQKEGEKLVLTFFGAINATRLKIIEFLENIGYRKRFQSIDKEFKFNPKHFL
jgi:hypothetical protein